VGDTAKIFDRVPARFMVPSVAWQYRYFEPELGRLNEFVPEGRGAVDVGVWWGPWTWWLARRVPRVDSFEPNPDFIARLASAMPNNVTIHPVALSNQSGRSNLWVPPGGVSGQGRASIEPQTRAGSDWRQQPIATSRLDDFELGDVGFVKIDVEGHELAVLQGATDLLKTQRPTLLIEIEQHADRQGSLDEIIDFFGDYSYSGQFLQKGRWLPISELDRPSTKQMAARVAQHGYLVNLLLYARRYIHNFVFKPL
jgi:FkbM family methyltransferase